MKTGVRMRMNPASRIRSGAWRSISAASAASKASRVACALWSIATVAMPCDRAHSSPCASGRLEITALTSRPVRASTIDRMLLPRPDIKMTPDFTKSCPTLAPSPLGEGWGEGQPTSNDDRLRRVRLARHDGADLEGLDAVRAERVDRRLGLGGG